MVVLGCDCVVVVVFNVAIGGGVRFCGFNVEGTVGAGWVGGC